MAEFLSDFQKTTERVRLRTRHPWYVGARMGVRLLSLVALVAAVVAPLAHGATRLAAAPQTTEPDTYLDINVTLNDRKITLSDRSAERGDGVTFHVRNTGTKPHSFALVGPGALSLDSAGLRTAALKPGQTAVLQVYLDYRGAIPFRSLVKGDATRITMRGVFFVT